jgi:peptidoglycan hydrolase-like protein with peptidoglycan-binding domain
LDGVPDGMIGPASTEALALYQSENGLPASGEMSVDTMFKLLLQ